LLWTIVLARHSLLTASSISSLRYVFVCAAAWMFFDARLVPRDAAGVALITAGVFLVAR
jgi:drug/metabolite transporter (DMT)-like permease